MRARPVREFMTPLPQTIGLRQSLADASRKMKELGVRHLPVLEGGVLRGILSERDIAFVKALDASKSANLKVEQAITPEPFRVDPKTPLAAVVETMAEHKYGCAVVMENEEVVGILTTTDAMEILSDLLNYGPGLLRSRLTPGQVRLRILRDHEVLRALIAEVDEMVEQVRAGEHVGGPLRSKIRDLYRSLCRHLDLEEAILVPALKDTDAFGPVRVDQLVAEHKKQRQQLEELLLQEKNHTDSDLADKVQQLTSDFLKDMHEEEESHLSAKILKDDLISADLFSG